MSLIRIAILTLMLQDAARAFQPGDVVLISQPCFVCSLIELEEGMPYSHGGVVVKNENGSWSIIEALDRIDRVPLQTFLSRRAAGTEPLVLHPKFKPEFQKLNEWLIARFYTEFASHHYDPDFLWDNRDSQGEKYYCSEFIAKLLNPALIQRIEPKPMHFQKYRNSWIQYFRGTPPDGKPGLSPADLARTLGGRANSFQL